MLVILLTGSYHQTQCITTDTRSCTLVVVFPEHVARRLVGGGFRGGHLVVALFVSDALWVVPVLTRSFAFHHVSGERGERRERGKRGARDRGGKVVMVCV